MTSQHFNITQFNLMIIIIAGAMVHGPDPASRGTHFPNCWQYSLNTTFAQSHTFSQGAAPVTWQGSIPMLKAEPSEAEDNSEGPPQLQSWW